MSEAAKARQAQAQKAWHKKNLERFNISFRKGQLDVYRGMAKRRGMSLASIIKKLLEEELKREEREMKFEFTFEGLSGSLVFENTTPNDYGNICGKFVWGDIEEYPTFRSIQQAEAFVQDQDELAYYIDQAAHS